MEKLPVVDTDYPNRQAAAGFTAGTLTKTASYTITQGDILAAGGHLLVNCTGASATDLSLPSAALVKGCKITMLKPSGDIDAYSFLATNSDTVEGSAANKRFQNVTNEKGACTIWSDGSDWRAISQKGTWVVNDA